ERRQRPVVEDLGDAYAHRSARLPGLGRRAVEVALDGGLLDAQVEEGLLDDDVADRLRRLRHRLRIVEVPEDLLRLVVDQVRELLHQLLALLAERDHRLFRLDRPLLAGEARDVARGPPVGRLGVDEGAGAVVGAKVTARTRRSPPGTSG